ncbi:MAG: hypothetical protein AAFR17_00655, partial [Pseudomonadota bacterium]
HSVSGTFAGQVFGSTATASATSPANAYPAVTSAPSYAPQVAAPMAANSATVTLSGNTADAGQSQRVSIQDPVHVVRYCIALNGIFPSRN